MFAIKAPCSFRMSENLRFNVRKGSKSVVMAGGVLEMRLPQRVDKAPDERAEPNHFLKAHCAIWTPFAKFGQSIQCDFNRCDV